MARIPALPVFRIAGRRVAVDVAHLAFATGIVGWCVWFGLDAWQSQADVENLIMIVPAAIAALAFYVAILVGCFRVVGREDDAVSQRAPLRAGMGAKIAGTMALLIAYVVTGPWIGFDVTSFGYILAMLLFLGERRWLVLLLVPTLFCVLAVYCFGTILGTPLPLLLVPDFGS